MPCRKGVQRLESCVASVLLCSGASGGAPTAICACVCARYMVEWAVRGAVAWRLLGKPSAMVGCSDKRPGTDERWESVF